MWENIKAFFKDSETIFWARLQMLVGAMGTAALAADWSMLLINGDPTWQQFAIFGVVFIQGALTEYFRRRRAEDME